MNDYEYDVKGAPVVYTNCAPEPNNPLNRPDISFVKPVITLVVFLIVNALSCVLLFKRNELFDFSFEHSDTFFILVWIFIDVLYVSLISKRTIIWLVHCYQKYAPDEVRLKCVYEPSCSEYMILALQKYGVIKGLTKGISRLLRCHPPNGGLDEP